MFEGPVQVAHAVDDVAEAAQRWVDRGVGPFFVIEHIAVRNVRVRGSASTFDHSSAYAQCGPIMVELICQHDGARSKQRVVGSTGIHHLACFVDDFERANLELHRAGFDEVLYAETVTGTPFAFHDVGSDRWPLLEIYERTPRLGRFYDMVRDASIGWTGHDPVRLLS